MNIRPAYCQGQLYAFIPDLSPDATAGVSPSATVASRPDHMAPLDPAGTHHPCQREL